MPADREPPLRGIVLAHFIDDPADAIAYLEAMHRQQEPIMLLHPRQLRAAHEASAHA